MKKLFRRAPARASSRLAAPRLKIHAYTVKKFSSLLTPAGGYINNSNKNNNLIIKLNNKTYILGRDFLEWFVGFTDGNFNISLRKFKDVFEGARRAPTFRIMRNTPQVAAETHFNKYPLLGHKKVTYSR